MKRIELASTYFINSFIIIEFKPHTYSKILSGLQATLTIQENDSISEISIVEQLFFSYDYIFMPWIWRVFEGSWNLKGFVANLVSRILTRFNLNLFAINTSFYIHILIKLLLTFHKDE